MSSQGFSSAIEKVLDLLRKEVESYEKTQAHCRSLARYDDAAHAEASARALRRVYEPIQKLTPQ